mmetsp:Transcript_39961/g.72428  ORF Transcript_39961/g.72428 Transcript_39961/m.72428 type:complete len:99 (+) Transcript_39961:505-801(+)
MTSPLAAPGTGNAEGASTASAAVVPWDERSRGVVGLSSSVSTVASASAVLMSAPRAASLPEPYQNWPVSAREAIQAKLFAELQHRLRIGQASAARSKT